MFYLENNTTFSGSDIKVYIYKDVNDFKKFKDKDLKRKLERVENPLYPDDPFSDFNPSDLDQTLEKSLQDIASKRPSVEEMRSVKISEDQPEKILNLAGTQEVLNQNKAPEIKKLPDSYRVPKNPDLPGLLTRGTYATEAEAEAARNALVQSQQAMKDWIKETSGVDTGVNPEDEVPQIKKDPPYVKVNYKGEEFTMSESDSKILQEDHKDPVVTVAPPVIDYNGVQTNKVNPNFVDVVKRGSDKKTLELIRKNQLAKINKNKNELSKDKNGNKFWTKPILELGSLYSITYSSFREKHAVRSLGRVSAVNYTKGQRTIAGSMNFAVFQSHELMDFLRPEGLEKDKVVILDQLPKFNLMLLMINEYGGASILHLFGVTISTESQQTSVEDLALMNNVTFYAEDIMTIENIGNAFETSLAMLHPTVIAERTLRFYKKENFTTLDGMLQSYSDSTNSGVETKGKLASLKSRSRGLF